VTPSVGRANPGPGAAARNREALVSAARRLFDDVGADVPMSRIASEAGVGQAVLYRVFPDRASAVCEVFSDDLDDLERLAAQSDLPVLLAAITRSAARSTGFVQLAAGHLDDPRLRELCDRLQVSLADCLERTAPARRPARPLSAADLVLGVQMVTGALATTPREERLAVALRAWGLLDVSVDLPGAGAYDQ